MSVRNVISAKGPETRLLLTRCRAQVRLRKPEAATLTACSFCGVSVLHFTSDLPFPPSLSPSPHLLQPQLLRASCKEMSNQRKSRSSLAFVQVKCYQFKCLITQNDPGGLSMPSLPIICPYPPGEHRSNLY